MVLSGVSHFGFLVLKVVKWSKEKVYVLVCLLFMIVPLIIRSLVNLPNGYYEQWDLWYRKLVVTHADAIGYGMLMAYLLQNKASVWHSKKKPFFLLGILCLLLLTNLAYDENVSVYKTIYLSVIAMSVAITLPFLSTLYSLKFGLETFTNISKWSYSLYLIHLPLLYLMHGNFRVEDACDALIFSAIYLAIAFAVSAVIYRFFEKPMMDFRDR
jgi:peptidoglycan/LPS O-acetylase OafA/YrhL